MKRGSERYIALDVLRGATIAAMILVNNPGSWSNVFPFLRHAGWVGCSFADLVFPFFLFIIGAAMAFSFAKFGGKISWARVGQILKRSAIIFLIGYALNAYPYYPAEPSDAGFLSNISAHFGHVRVFGVLQRLAMCYLFGGVLILWLKSRQRLIWSMLGLIAIHTLVLLLTGDPSAEGGLFSLQGQGVGVVDVVLVGVSRVYGGYGVAFDPEGVVGVISGVSTLLLGYLIGMLIRESSDKVATVKRLFVIATMLIGGGLVLSLWLPIIKPLWTGSYVLYAGGWSVALLALFIYLIDIRGIQRAFLPFKALGLNPLFCYVMAEMLAKVLWSAIRWSERSVGVDGEAVERIWLPTTWYYERVCVWIVGADCGVSSLIYSLSIVGVVTITAIVLYRRKIVIKI